MISESDIVYVDISAAHLALVEKYLDAACMGGVSSVRRSDDRKANLRQDQLTGLLGNLGVSLHLYRSEEPFEKARKHANAMSAKDPTWGDGGIDFPNTCIDVKTSRKIESLAPLYYNLLVRPDERHKGRCYIQALAIKEEGKYRVAILGWLPESELPTELSADRRFPGAFARRVKELRPMKTFITEEWTINERFSDIII